MKIDHIGIAVENCDEMSSLYEQLLGEKASTPEEFQGMKISFIKTGESCIEFLEPIDKTTSIGKFIEKKGPGMHHIAFQTDNIEKKLEELKEKGFKLIDEKPRAGAHGTKVAFVHPKATGKILIEFCEK